LRQVDVKILVAYSRIGHIALVLVGIISFFNIGMNGGLLLMLAHGICSSVLFLMVDLPYNSVKSRTLILLKGIIIYLPGISL
jgi:NADH-ubiquinone oxidoreductase chain 4